MQIMPEGDDLVVYLLGKLSEIHHKDPFCNSVCFKKASRPAGPVGQTGKTRPRRLPEKPFKAFPALREEEKISYRI